MGIEDLGMGIEDFGMWIGPNPKSPIPTKPLI